MKINIRGDNLKVTDAIRAYIEKKINKLDIYLKESNDVIANVVIRTEKINQKIEVTIPLKVFTLRAEERHNDLYAAIDLVVDKLERQIRRNKGRLQNKFKANEPIGFDMSFETSKEEENNEYSIVKRKTIEMKPMSEEEAIIQMELLGHDFFIFTNADKDCFSVIYKRKDNSYGIIDTN